MLVDKVYKLVGGGVKIIVIIVVSLGVVNKRRNGIC